MSKESSIPLIKTFLFNKDGKLYDPPVTVPLRWRRYPVSRNVAELIGADKDSGHRVPPPSSRRKRRK